MNETMDGSGNMQCIKLFPYYRTESVCNSPSLVLSALVGVAEVAARASVQAAAAVGRRLDVHGSNMMHCSFSKREDNLLRTNVITGMYTVRNTDATKDSKEGKQYMDGMGTTRLHGIRSLNAMQR